MRGLAAALFLAVGLGAASAQTPSPFSPPEARAAKLVKALTPPDFIDRAVIEAFETQSGLTVALDTYASPAEFAESSGERRYDLVILRGPLLARRLSALTRLDRSRLANAHFVQPLVAAKYAAYDREGAHGVPFGWSAFGLLYDSDKLREPPVSWIQALGATKEARRLGDCGIVWPDAREESFLAAWKLYGLDPARAKPADVKYAATLLDRARGTYVGFAVADEVGALAKGAACIGAGSAGEAVAVATRGYDSPPNIRFAYPREGAPLTLYALAIPADAPSPDAAYALLDALLDPENARRDAASAGVIGAQETTDLDQLKRLTPEPSFDATVSAAMQNEWKRLTSPK
jgi:putrescine transport system substrate-binding protein